MLLGLAKRAGMVTAATSVVAFCTISFVTYAHANDGGKDENPSTMDFNGIEGPGEYIIIYPNEFTSPALTLANWRSQNDNLVVAFVKKEDIFSDPRFQASTNDQKIKNFLAYAYNNWSIKPKYCCLYGSDNHLPKHEANLWGHDCFWESWFGCVTGDDEIPEISIGRININTATQGDACNVKVAEYETGQGLPWTYKNLFIADDCIPPGSNPVWDWKQRQEKHVEDLESILPAGFTHETSHMSDAGDPITPGGNYYPEILYGWFNDKVNAGASLICFMGQTDHDWFLNISNLSNGDKYPIYIRCTCWSSFTSTPCAAFLTFSGKGGIATIANATENTIAFEGIISRYLYYNVYEQKLGRLGDIVTDAQKTILLTYPELHEQADGIFLFGDPALRVDISSGYSPRFLAGWPQYQEDTIGLAVGDFTPPPSGGGDDLETVTKDICSVSEGAMLCFDSNGVTLAASAMTDANSVPTVADVNADGKPDMINADNNTLTILDADGNVPDGFPIYFDGQNEQITKSPAVGDIFGDGYFDIAVATEDLTPPGGKLHVYNRVGNELPGWPKTFNWTPSSPPAIGDVDADGELEIVITVKSGNTSVMHVLKKDGNAESGWPKTFEGVVLTPPVLADVDTPDDVEIVVAGTEPGSPPKGHLYVYKSDGTQHRHFEKNNAEFPIRPIVGDFLQILGNQAIVPEKIDGELKWLLIYQIGYGTVYDNIQTSHTITSAPTAGDVDGDGKYEVVVGMNGRIMAYNFDDLQPVPGWTGGLSGSVKSPVVADVNADGLADIVAGDGKAVYVMTTNTAYNGFPNDLDWIGPRHDNMNTGLFDIAAPTAVEAYDYPGDQGGVICVRWTKSMDDGLRSTRVQNYMLFRGESLDYPGDSGGSKPLNLAGYNKKRREGGIGNRAGKVYEERKFKDYDEWSATRGREMDITYEKIAVLPAGTTYYEDDDVINGQGYNYYLVATSTSGQGPVGNNYRYSQPSASRTAAAHDNIPPAPPTDFDLDIIHGQPPIVHLMWTRSVDDPLYQEGQGEPGPLDNGGEIARGWDYGRGGGVTSPVPSNTAGTVGSASASAPAGVFYVNAGSGSPGAHAYARSPATPSFLTGKQGEAAKMKAAGRGYIPHLYGTTGPRLWTGRGDNSDGGANDVETYEIDKNAQIIYYYPQNPDNEVDYWDYEVSYGNIYYYTIYARDSENASEGVGPLVANLVDVPDGREPVALAPESPFVSNRFGNPFDGGGSAATPFAETGWGASRTKPASVITCKPNPVTGTATFTITLPAACPVKLDVYDLSGRKVDTVLNKAVKEGGETVLWEPSVPTGVYIYRLETPHRQYSGKVVVAK
jgi:hypothetical protein